MQKMTWSKRTSLCAVMSDRKGMMLKYLALIFITITFMCIRFTLIHYIVTCMNISVIKCPGLGSDHWADVIVLLFSFAGDLLFSLINSCVCVWAGWWWWGEAAVVGYGRLSPPPHPHTANRLQHIPFYSCIPIPASCHHGKRLPWR